VNYDEARAIPGKGWHWTTMRDGVVRTAEPCIRHVGDETHPLWYMQPSKPEEWERCEPHATREEAERHYYDWCLSTATDIQLADQQLRCRAEGCEAWTDTELGNRQLERMFNGDPLCAEHRTRDVLATLHPFTPGLRSVHS
jgi:hypothetical protein